MRNKIRLRTSEVVEYANLLARMAFDPTLELKGKPEPEYEAIKTATDAGLTTLLGLELTFFVKTLYVQQIAQYSGTVQEIEEVGAFLSYLEALEERELLDLYLEALIERKAADGVEAILADIREDDFLSVVAFDEEAFLEFIQNFGLYRERLLLFLKQFNDKVFEPHKEKIMAFSASHKEALEANYLSNPKAFIQLVIRPNGELFVKEAHYHADIYVCVTYPNNLAYMMKKNHPEHLYVTFGSHVMSLMVADRSEEAMKYLGEATKLSIIKLLGSGPRYASEVAKALHLNRATISHHLNQLVSIGAITIAYQSGNRSYYELNLDQIQARLEEFMVMLGNLHQEN